MKNLFLITVLVLQLYCIFARPSDKNMKFSDETIKAVQKIKEYISQQKETSNIEQTTIDVPKNTDDVHNTSEKSVSIEFEKDNTKQDTDIVTMNEEEKNEDIIIFAKNVNKFGH